MSALWTMRAVRDRLHPVVVGYVHGDPAVLARHAPGTFDALSDCFQGDRIRPRRAGGLLGWSRDASDFLAYARLCEELPGVDTALAGQGRLPATPSLCLTLSLAVVQALAGRTEQPRLPGQVRDFLEMVLDGMPEGVAGIVAAAALDAYGLPVADRDLVLERLGEGFASLARR